MKKTLLIFALFLMSATGFAQTGDYLELMSSVIKTEKKALISEVMELSSEESVAFWALYNEYEQKIYKANQPSLKAIQDFAENFENMSDEVAAEILANSVDSWSAEAKIKKAYSKKFVKQLGAKRALKFMQLMNKIDVMIDAEISNLHSKKL